MNAEKTRGTSMDAGSRTHHHQTASVSRGQADPACDERNRTAYGRAAFERSFRTQGRGDSRAISALDAKLSAMQNLIYGPKNLRTSMKIKKKA